MQIFRLVALNLIAPEIYIGLYMNGLQYCFQYATQWSAYFSVVCFALTWYSARLDRQLLKDKELITADYNNTAVNVRASMQSADPNILLNLQLEKRELRCLRVRGWASVF